MALATIDASGLPDVRMVLLKGIDQRGLVFYTNEESAKGRQIAASPRAAALFHWKSLRRQIRSRGPVALVSDEEADAYFKLLRDSRIGAWASQQSRPLESRFALEKAIAYYAAKFGVGEVPRPPYWRGFCLTPVADRILARPAISAARPRAVYAKARARPGFGNASIPARAAPDEPGTRREARLGSLAPGMSSKVARDDRGRDARRWAARLSAVRIAALYSLRLRGGIAGLRAKGGPRAQLPPPAPHAPRSPPAAAPTSLGTSTAYGDTSGLMFGEPALAPTVLRRARAMAVAPNRTILRMIGSFLTSIRDLQNAQPRPRRRFVVP